MFFRFFILFSFSLCVSQESTSLNNLNLDNSLFQNDNFFIELNNIGDPILFLKPFNYKRTLSFSHYSKRIREIDYFNNQYNFYSDSIFSEIFYKSSYSQGGVVEAFLKRPIEKYIQLELLYKNLTSKGFYANQNNKYSDIYLSIHYLRKQKPYSFSFSFSSNNGVYNQNGGVLYNSSVSTDLMDIYLQSAQTSIKNRKIDFIQNYFLNQHLKFQHNFIWIFFDRKYNDSNPESYHYSLTPLFYKIVSDYHCYIFYSRILNSISLSNNNFIFSINHNYYNTNDIISNNLGDIDIAVSNTEVFRKLNSIDFLFNFSPSGYNKHNYLIDFIFYKKIKNINNKFGLNLKSKKPDFFTKHYDTSYSFDWNTFSPIKTFSIFLNSFFETRDILISSFFNYYSNYLYFNTLVSPIQSEDNIAYFNLNFNKSWKFNNWLLKSTFCFQKSDNIILSVPSFLLKQKIQYERGLISDIRLLTSINFGIFSKYYVNSYFPLTDLFYQQINEKRGLIPLISLDLSIHKKNFYFGLIFKNLNNFFSEGEYFVQDYPIPPQTLQFSIKWQFLD